MISRLLPVALVLIAIGLFFGYINPTYSGHVTELRNEIKSYDAALVAAKKFVAEETKLKLQRSSISDEDLARIEAFLPDGVDNVRLILDLNSLASRSGVVLSNFDMAGTAVPTEGDKLSLSSGGPVESLDLSVSATGNYNSFKSFLKGAELSLRPLDLIDLSIDDSNTGVYSYTMTFRIYWLR